MTQELFVAIFSLTILSIALITVNFIALSNLKYRQGFREEVHTFVKIIILIPPFGIVLYFLVELIDFFNDYFE